MDSLKIKNWMDNPHQIAEDELLELSELVSLYPYAQPLRLLYLTILKERQSPELADELKHAALYIADRKLLFYFANSEETKQPQPVSSGEVDLVVPSNIEEDSDRTLSVIDSFLSTLPEDEQGASNELDLASDYTGFLLEEEEMSTVPPLQGQELIDQFINKQDGALPEPPKPQERVADELVSNNDPLDAEAEDDGFFTETLAKIYVKQERYSKALEILKKLSLKYPNKNAYFADQIRFLEKLIINTKPK